MNKRQRLLRAAPLVLVLALAACGGGSNEPSAPAPPGPGSDIPAPAPLGDPLFSYQWHLKNTGQSTFSSEGGTPGIDLGLGTLFESGVRGQGVKVLVLDDGLDIRHPDLAANVDASLLHSFRTGSADPTPTRPGDNHGTSVAGIIAAVADNGKGGRGVAPGVSLGGADVLDCGPRCATEDPRMDIEAYGGAPFSAGSWVINGSFGEDPSAPADLDIDVVNAPLAGLSLMRDGKGVVLVKSAGNEFVSFEVKAPGGGEADPGPCGHANQHALSCQNASFDLSNLAPQAVVVGAVNARGVRASYSTAGSALLVAGLGGEFGQTKPDSPATAGPAILTTDLADCTRGNSRVGLAASEYANDFDRPGTSTNTEFNAACDYTAAMNGTSAAAPTVTGVVALMLQANPALTWRDIRRILVHTSRRVDANQAQVALSVGGADYVAEPGWVRNGAGLWFSNWYGFGLVDAAAAVDAARATTTHLSGAMTSSGWLVDAPAAPATEWLIPVADAAGLTRTLSAGARTVETVQLRLAINGTAPLGDLGIELISPSGTRSVMMNAHNAFQNSSMVSQFTLASNAFYDEAAAGTWTLRIVDVNGRADASLQAGLQSWSLRILGH